MGAAPRYKLFALFTLLSLFFLHCLHCFQCSHCLHCCLKTASEQKGYYAIHMIWLYGFMGF